MNQPFLQYGRQTVDDADIEAVARVLRGDFLTTGPAVAGFEEKLAGVTGAAHVISCSSGTAALHLAMMAVGLGPGDKAVVPTITFLATANAVRYVGADVVFCDVVPDTGLMGVENLERVLAVEGNDIKAVLPVHLAGQSPDMASIAALAREHGLAVVEDACHALGTTYVGSGGDTPVGGCRDSDMATFSFHPVKTIAMGEGGAITTNDARLAESLRCYRNHGMSYDDEHFANADMAFAADGSANPWYYEMPEPGFNYRASDIHCALGLSQLGKLDHFVAARRDLVACYDRLIAPLAPRIRPLGRAGGCRPGWHLYIALIDFEDAGVSRAEVMDRLLKKGIGTQVHYIPVHTQPYYQSRYGEYALPGAEAYYARCLTLPLHVGMEERDVERVVADLADICGQ